MIITMLRTVMHVHAPTTDDEEYLLSRGYVYEDDDINGDQLWSCEIDTRADLGTVYFTTTPDPDPLDY